MTPTKYQANGLFGLVTSRWKLIHSKNTELYDLETDPGEMNNVIDVHPDRATELLGQLEKILEIEPPSVESEDPEWDEGADRRLKSLGYVGPSLRRRDFGIDAGGNDARKMLSVYRSVMQTHGLIVHSQFAEARKICTKLVEQYPTYGEGYALLGKIAMGEQNYREATMHWSKSLEFNPEDPIAHNQLGLALFELGDLSGAIKSARNLLDIDPSLAVAHSNLGRYLVHHGQLTEGMECLQNALAINPDLGMAHLSLADAMTTNKDFDQAEDHYQRTIELGVKVAETHLQLAGICRIQNRLSEAIEHCRRAIEAREDYIAAHHNLATALQAEGNDVEAVKHFYRAVELDPQFVLSLNNLAWILATHPDPKIRQKDEALTFARRAADATKYQAAGILDTLAAAYANSGQFEEAVETAHSALKLLTSSDQDAFKQEILQRIQVYQQGKAFRQEIP